MLGHLEVIFDALLLPCPTGHQAPAFLQHSWFREPSLFSALIAPDSVVAFSNQSLRLLQQQLVLLAPGEQPLLVPPPHCAGGILEHRLKHATLMLKTFDGSHCRQDKVPTLPGIYNLP